MLVGYEGPLGAVPLGGIFDGGNGGFARVNAITSSAAGLGSRNGTGAATVNAITVSGSGLESISVTAAVQVNALTVSADGISFDRWTEEGAKSNVWTEEAT